MCGLAGNMLLCRCKYWSLYLNELKCFQILQMQVTKTCKDTWQEKCLLTTVSVFCAQWPETVLHVFILLTYFCDSPWWLKPVGISLAVLSVCNYSAFNWVTFPIVAEMLLFYSVFTQTADHASTAALFLCCLKEEVIFFQPERMAFSL